MAARKMEIATAAFVLAMMMTLLASKAVAQNNSCSSVMMTLSPCLDFIGNKALEPGFSCCTTLGGIVQTDPRCLCMVLDGTAASFGIAINHTRALELPGICKVEAPPVSRCTAIPIPPETAPPSSESPEEPGEEIEEAPKGSLESNTTSSSRKSKNAANLMATILIPACALIYVF
ncbi:non-specific lipid transfer protein GPI-anchored 5 [Lolium perenne]|uniref:non-specific lipid transfer protein GPI-anchored 5 n=1 Tax=Lolium perenne TaxID=4522 RepID=UPI0021F6958F|nr:non-specific lipid transfer protein GPI-anchored 5-like [Lolium perenne]